jgi:tetratricopeptide (TPR) repeat protein
MNAAHSHNELIQSLAETGILGFCALCFFLALFFIQGYRSWIRTTELNSERFLFLGCYCNVVTSILCGLFGFPWQVPVTGMLFWVILGMTLKLDTCPNESFWPGSIHSIITNWWNENRILSLSLVSIIWLGYTVWGLPFAINHYRASLDIRQGRYFAEQEGRFDEAITVMEDAVRIDPTNGLANYYLGGYYAHQQRGTEALERYEASLQNYNDSHIFFNIGQIHFGHKEFPKAQEYFVKALFLNPHYYMASRQLGLIYAYNNDWNNALVYLKKYMESNPSGPEGDQIRAIIPEIENQMKIVESHTSGGKK